MKKITDKVFIFIIAIIITITIFTLSYSGMKFLTVSGTSMNPEITQDDVVIVKPIDIKYLAIGDIITYRRNIEGKNFDFTHRIIDIKSGIIKTKGDNLPNPDRYDIMPKDVVGKVIVKIPYVGSIIRFAHSSMGYLILIFIPSILLIAIEIKKIVKGNRL